MSITSAPVTSGICLSSNAAGVMSCERVSRVVVVDHLDDLATFNFWDFFGGLIVIEKKPHTKAQVLALLNEEGERFAGWLDTLNDELLAEKVAMFPGMGTPKSRFEMLLSPKEHEMHHRGQLMLVERLIGVVPHLTRERTAAQAQAREAQARG